MFGVEIRLHSFFALLLVGAAGWAMLLGRSPIRGILLWLLLLLAVLLREVARAIAAAWFGLDLSRILLMPTGGMQTFADAESEKHSAEPKVLRVMAVTGPIANLLAGAVFAGAILAISPQVDLNSVPWVSPLHLLKTMVWLNFLLAALNLLPAWPLDGGRVARGEVIRGVGLGSARAKLLSGRLRVLVYVSWWIALAMITYGLVSPSPLVLFAGLGVLLGAQVERQSFLPDREVDGTRVGDVMLTEYSILPASATLEDALMTARHSLQDVFPVVRAGNMVGAVGRQSIVEALATSGNGYVQGIMTRSFQTAAQEDSLVETLNRAMAAAGADGLQIVPVVDGDAVVGILTPQHLHRSLGLLPRRFARVGRSSTEDESD